MSKGQLNVRISLETRRILDWLRLNMGEAEGAVIARALDRMYQEEQRRCAEFDRINDEKIGEAEQIKADEEHDARVRGYDIENDE